MYGDRPFSDVEIVIRLALYRDALVQFVACFDGSAPLFLAVPSVYPGDPNAQSFFESLKALRNNFAAHRHGAARQCVMGVVADASGPIGVGKIAIHVVVPEIVELRHILAFVWKARRHVQERAEMLNVVVTQQGMAMSRENILLLPGAHGYNMRPEDMRLSRERLARQRAHADRQPSKTPLDEKG